jgi:hypothetical protein
MEIKERKKKNNNPPQFKKNQDQIATKWSPNKQKAMTKVIQSEISYLGGFIRITSFSYSSSIARGEDQQSIWKTKLGKTKQSS